MSVAQRVVVDARMARVNKRCHAGEAALPHKRTNRIRGGWGPPCLGFGDQQSVEQTTSSYEFPSPPRQSSHLLIVDAPSPLILSFPLLGLRIYLQLQTAAFLPAAIATESLIFNMVREDLISGAVSPSVVL